MIKKYRELFYITEKQTVLGVRVGVPGDMPFALGLYGLASAPQKLRDARTTCPFDNRRDCALASVHSARQASLTWTRQSAALESAGRAPRPGRGARPALGAGPWPRCAAAALRGGRKCVPSGGPCSAPARRSHAPQVSGEGGGGRGRAGGRSPGGTGKPRAGPRGREKGRYHCVETPEAAPGGGRVPGPVLRGTTLPLPGCAGRAGERPERAPGRASRVESGRQCSPLGLRWLGVGAMHTLRNGVWAGERLGPPVGGGPLQLEMGLRPR